ncbi:MAG: hypothetical protein F6K30_29025 [Cyanothece sp. SIO2G6]|nr:hypothetical protein [Cyanothece sp. SIO2G6]
MNEVSELRRIEYGVTADDNPRKLGLVTFHIICSGNSETVLLKAKEVLKNFIISSSEQWPTAEQWRNLLPKWFVNECAEEKTKEEMEKYLENLRKLPSDEREQIIENIRWSLENWLYWLAPSERQWFWWDAEIVDENLLHIVVEVKEWPFAWKALAWLFRASGAVRVIPEE